MGGGSVNSCLKQRRCYLITKHLEDAAHHELPSGSFGQVPTTKRGLSCGFSQCHACHALPFFGRCPEAWYCRACRDLNRWLSACVSLVNYPMNYLVRRSGRVSRNELDVNQPRVLVACIECSQLSSRVSQHRRLKEVTPCSWSEECLK
jgi:hypothetical protein